MYNMAKDPRLLYPASAWCKFLFFNYQEGSCNFLVAFKVINLCSSIYNRQGLGSC